MPTQSQNVFYLVSPKGDSFGPLFLLAIFQNKSGVINTSAERLRNRRPGESLKSGDLWISLDPARQYSSQYAHNPNPTNSVDPDVRQFKPT